MNDQKKRWFPNVYALLFLLAVVAAVMTWVIPAGSFERVTEGGITSVVPGTFALASQVPQGPWQVFEAIVSGFKAQVSLILMILFVGAAVNMLAETKAIDTIFTKLAKAVEGREEKRSRFFVLWHLCPWVGLRECLGM